MKEFESALKDLEGRGLLRKLICLDSSHGSKVIIDGEPFINFASNDYLNLSCRPEIINALADAVRVYGFGSGSSRLLSGTYLPHKRLEDRIARFKGTEAALLFNTGYAANTGIIPAITNSDSVIFSDELNHASIIDGIRLSKAEVKIYRHKDIGHLESLLSASAAGSKIRKRLIVTDSVFSMDGDIAPLKDISYLSKQYEALLMVDDAHATGVLGKNGKGGLEYFGIDNDEIIQMGTLSKALGCFGAFVAGPQELIDYLINTARSFIFSTSLPPAIAEAAITAIDIVASDSGDLRARLLNNSDRLRKGLEGIGFKLLGSETPIIPILTGEIKDTLEISAELYKNKILALPVRPPTVPEGRCRIRFSVTAGHDEGDIVNLIKILGEIRNKAGL